VAGDADTKAQFIGANLVGPVMADSRQVGKEDSCRESLTEIPDRFSARGHSSGGVSRNLAALKERMIGEKKKGGAVTEQVSRTRGHLGGNHG